MAAVARQRSSSEPAIPLLSSSYGRTRKRMSTLNYEKDKDKMAYLVSTSGYNEICALLESLVARCSLNQLEYLWTALESVPHRDLLSHLEGKSRLVQGPLGGFRPLSTPLSREITAEISQNTEVYHVPSTVINNKVVAPSPFHYYSDALLLGNWSTSPEASSPSKLPGIRPSTQASVRMSSCTPLKESRSQHYGFSPIPTVGTAFSRSATPSCRLTLRSRATRTPMTRCLSTPPTRVMPHMRRHMLQESTGELSSVELVALPEKISKSLHTASVCVTPKRSFLSNSPPHTRMLCQETFLPQQAVHLLSWFSRIPLDWQQQELLLMVVTNLDDSEKYFLATLLMSRQFRDFVSHLPEALVRKVMSFVPAKNILKHCCLVSSTWNARCSAEEIWSLKTHQRRMVLPLSNFTSWKNLYLDDLRLKMNWVRGCYASQTLSGHTSRVLCAQLKDGFLATGSGDKTVRVWKLTTGECISTLFGHLRAVRCVCFYGKDFIITGASDHLIKIWNFRTGVCERTLSRHSGTVWAIQQKGDMLISGGKDTSALLWDIRRCLLHVLLEGHQGSVFGVDLDSSGQTAFTSAGDKTLRQWEVSSGVCLRVAQVSAMHSAVGLHWDQGFLLTCSGNVITLWDAESLERVKQFEGHQERVDTVQLRVYDVSQCRGLVLSASRDKTVKYWDVKSGRCIRTLKGYEKVVSGSCAVCDETRIVSTDGACVKVLDFHPHRAVPLASDHQLQE